MLALSDRESILFHSAAVPSWSCASIVLSRVVYYTITWYATATPTSTVYGIDSLKCTDQAGLPAFWRQLESSAYEIMEYDEDDFESQFAEELEMLKEQEESECFN